MTTTSSTVLSGANLVTKRMLPLGLKRPMNLWREGFAEMPSAYIEFHKEIATDVLNALVAEYGIRVIETTLRDAGWMDGMKEVNVVVEDRRGNVHRLVYCDANQGFMVRCKSGGSASFTPKRLFNGEE